MKNPLVVGYRGEIGSYILQGLIKYMPTAIPISCFDKNETWEEKLSRIMKADVIFLCVPVEETANFICTWGPYLRGTMLVEQTSLKSVLYNHGLAQNLIAQFGIEVVSMHVLFRPSRTPNREDRRVVFIGETEQTIDKELLSFIWAGLEVDDVTYFETWQDHDKEMALQQALIHRVLLVLSRMLTEKTSSKYNTLIGSQIISLANRILAGNKSLYTLIQSNPELKTKLQDFKSRLGQFDTEQYL